MCFIFRKMQQRWSYGITSRIPDDPTLKDLRVIIYLPLSKFSHNIAHLCLINVRSAKIRERRAPPTGVNHDTRRFCALQSVLLN